MNNEIIQIFEKGNIKTITLAPETAYESLRYAIGKRVSNEKIYSILTQIRDSQIKNVKLYFLVGLPNETNEDIYDTIDLIKKINNLGFEKKSLRINVNPFIPKLNTPYEKEINFFLDRNIVGFLTKYKLIEKELKQFSSIQLKFRNYKTLIKSARLQTIISLGDERITELLINYYHDGANFKSLNNAEKDLNFSLDDYLLEIRNCFSPWNF